MAGASEAYVRQNWAELQEGILWKSAVVLSAVALVGWYQQVSVPEADLRLVVLIVASALLLVAVSLVKARSASLRAVGAIVVTLVAVYGAHVHLRYDAAAAFLLAFRVGPAGRSGGLRAGHSRGTGNGGGALGAAAAPAV